MTTTMAPASTIHMPGSFLPRTDENNHDRIRTSSSSFQCAPFNSSVFLPPPSSLDSSHTSSTFLPISNHTPLSRKRPRSQPKQQQHTWTPNHLTDSVHLDASDAPSPSPLIDTTYRFANGLDAATDLDTQRRDLEKDRDYEHDCRPNRYIRQASAPKPLPRTPSSTSHATVVGEKRPYSPSSRQGWGKTVVSLAGGVAGKVLTFCWNSAVSFKGFYAGGGTGYQVGGESPDLHGSSWSHVDSRQDVFAAEYKEAGMRHGRDMTPVPGGFPEDLTANNHSDYSDVHSKWVMVNDFGSSSRDTSPVRKKSKVGSTSASTASTAKNSSNPSPMRAVTHNLNGNNRPRMVSRSSGPRSSASFASPRISSANKYTSTNHQSRPSLQSSSTINHNITNSTKRPSSRASMASPRRQSSFNVVASTQPNSHSYSHSASTSANQSPEVRKFQQKLRRKEAQKDQSMDWMNEQLQAMIKQGKQALGSKIEVEGEVEEEDDDDGVDRRGDIDEGYEEGGGWEREDEMVMKKWF